MRTYANSLGIACQIADDIADLLGESNMLGKPAGNSLLHERPLLPVLYLRHRAGAPWDRLEDIRQPGWPRAELVALLEEHHAFEESRSMRRGFLERALAALDGLEGAAGVQILRELAARVAAHALA
jgi:geranylgeranyl pyrophosphate synthase